MSNQPVSNNFQQAHNIEPPAGITPPKKKKSALRSFLKTTAIIVGVGLIFWFGHGVGSGEISLRNTYQAVSGTNNLPEDLDYAEIEALYDILRQHYDGDLTVEALIEGLKSGLINATGDTYTEYMNAEEAAQFNSQLSGTFSGIGAELGKNNQDELTIIAPISGFPAEKAGLRAQDVILTIDGDSTSGLSVTEAVAKIRGEKGTKVTLGVLRGGSERREFTITRDTITIPSVEYKIKEGNIGYIQINQFWTDTADLTREAAEAFKAAGVEGVVLDLRGNPGGSLDAAVDVASVWLPNGKTVLQEKRDGKVVETFTATGSPLLKDVPTRVLIDEGSASASEIVAGALKDNGAATLVGVKSYGKGSVQQIINLKNGGQLKVTIARWYRPNGENIDQKGITPDVLVERTEEQYANGVDPQLEAALKALAE